MRLCSIASGSSGNCIYVGSEETHVLVDTGISGKRIEQGLNQLELTGRDIAAILVTHEHSDHISGLGVMARRYHIPVYTTGGTADAISRMNAMLYRNVMFRGTRLRLYTNHAAAAARANTKITAMPMPAAVSTFLETPRKGQIPKNWDIT